MHVYNLFVHLFDIFIYFILAPTYGESPTPKSCILSRLVNPANDTRGYDFACLEKEKK